MRLSIVVPVIALIAQSAELRAQVCTKGPGSAFGVTGYTCTECQVEWDRESTQRYTFTAAPVVLTTTSRSFLQRGDVIEAIDGSPITTMQGAESFARPKNGEHTLTLRRNGARTDMTVRALPCDGDQSKSDRWVRVMSYANPLRADTAIRGQPTPMPGEPVLTINKVEPAPSESQGKFGFAVACVPSCTKIRPSADPKDAYWKYDTYPQIAAVRGDSPAERAGLRIGDVVTKVDGMSVLEQKGALRLFQSEGSSALNITVLRDGKEMQTMLTPAQAKTSWQHLLDRGGQHVWFDSASISRNESLLSVRVRSVEDRLDGKTDNRAVVNAMDFVCTTRMFRTTSRADERDGKSTGTRAPTTGSNPWVYAAPGLLEGLILDSLCSRFGPARTP